MEQASLSITGSNLGTSLQDMLMADDIQPGAEPSYQLCKEIFLMHPLGAKMAEVPISIAMSQQRDISIPKGPEDRIKKAFLDEWKKLHCDKHIFNVMRTARIYGVGSIVYGATGVPTDRPIAMKALADMQIYFNVVDPLNTAGSLVLDQNPNAPDFQKHTAISVSGQPYHRSRSCVILNEEPIYIAYTNSAFGYVGRSVYQRALFPLKTFIQSMITDDLVTKKSGLIVAMIKAAGSIADKMMASVMAVKRNLLKEAETGNVISIGHEDKIESINMQNTDNAMTTARKNVLENIASAASMPAALLNNETFAAGFGEGTEDAKAVAQYIDGIRDDMQPLYDFFDQIVMYRAWNPAFYETIQADFPEYRKIGYTEAFYQWSNSFAAKWPSLLIEPESERIKVDEIRMKGIISAADVLMDHLDPDNKALLIEWVIDNFNEQKLLYKQELNLDIDGLKEFLAEQQQTLDDQAAEMHDATVEATKNPPAPVMGGGEDGPPQKKPGGGGAKPAGGKPAPKPGPAGPAKKPAPQLKLGNEKLAAMPGAKKPAAPAKKAA